MIITNNKIPFINSGAFDHGFFYFDNIEPQYFVKLFVKESYKSIYSF